MAGNARELPPLIVLAGPTGVGKTSLSITAARETGGEIINADSRSFYRGMDIGTAKPGPDERAAVPHHLIDVLDPADEMSLSLFQQLAFTAIDLVLGRSHVPFLVGGTAQYLNAVVENWNIPQVAPDRDLRQHLEERVAVEGVAPLLAELRSVDPASAERTGPNPRRIIRAMEIFRLTGNRMSDLQGKQEPRYRTLELELWLPREVLHQRIADRIEQQVKNGLFDEVRALLDGGIDPAIPAFSSIGYRDVFPYLRGESTVEETKAAIRFASNRLVRHQQTWLRKNPRMIRIDMSEPSATRHVLKLIEQHLTGR
jgi:tRNA dimethylallyltransferase